MALITQTWQKSTSEEQQKWDRDRTGVWRVLSLKRKKETDLKGAERKNGENKCTEQAMKRDGAAGVTVTGFGLFLNAVSWRGWDRKTDNERRIEKRGKREVEREMKAIDFHCVHWKATRKKLDSLIHCNYHLPLLEGNFTYLCLCSGASLLHLSF